MNYNLGEMRRKSIHSFIYKVMQFLKIASDGTFSTERSKGHGALLYGIPTHKDF